MIDSKENCRVKEGLSKEVIFKRRSDEREGSRHVKKKRNVPDRGNSMFPDKRKSLACYRNQEGHHWGREWNEISHWLLCGKWIGHDWQQRDQLRGCCSHSGKR